MSAKDVGTLGCLEQKKHLNAALRVNLMRGTSQHQRRDNVSRLQILGLSEINKNES